MDGFHHYHNGQRDADAHAPEAVDMLSPMTPVTNLESELQSKYQSARDVGRHPQPTPADTEKEVVNMEHDNAAKHVVPLELSSQYPETATIVSPQTPWTVDSETAKARSLADSAPEALPYRGDNGADKKDQKILGMSKKVFLIVVVVIIIIIAAAVGGGVGGAIASTKKSDATPATSTSSPASSSTTPPTSSTKTSATSTTNPTPTQTIRFLNNQTFPEGYNFAFQGYSRSNFTGAATEVFTGPNSNNIGQDFEFDLHSYIWVPNIGNCCVNLCANSTKQGYLGYRCTPMRRNETSDPVARAFVWCSDTHSESKAASMGCS